MSLDLVEYETKLEVELSPAQLDGIRKYIHSLSITPSLGKHGCYDLTPGSVVGAIDFDALQIRIHPKIPIDRLFFLLSFSLNPKAWQETTVGLPPDTMLFEAVAHGFVRVLERALQRGLLQGYRTTEEALPTVRGRIRIEDQVRRHFGLAPPVEVRYDEFTDDIEENRLLRAALHRIGRSPVRFAETRRRMRRVEYLLQRVKLIEYDARSLPQIVYTRLNEHYRLPVELARLILQSTSIQEGVGKVHYSAFLIDMNRVFEDFVVVALREALRVSDGTLVQGSGVHALWLDVGHHIRLKPDISLWEGGRCRFVGDVKYKRLKVEGMPNADVYQLLAYLVATGLPRGILVYASGEHKPEIHHIPKADKQIEVLALDLSQPPQGILDQVSHLAQRINLAPGTGQQVSAG